MPVPLTIQILSGPNMGKRQRFTQGPVTFGRDADNGIVLAEPFVSRKHGSLVVIDDRWALLNLSANGTKVNARLVTAVGKRPRKLRHGDVIAVGNQPVFTVGLEAGSDAPAESDAAAAAPARRRLSARGKLWAAVGVYVLLMIGLFVFLSTLGGDGPGAGPRPAELSPAEVEAQIRAPLAPMQPPNPGAAARYLDEAREWYFRRETDRSAAFRALLKYKQALAAADRVLFEEGLDQQRYLEVQNELVERVERLYRRGVNQTVAGNYQGAVESFDELLAIYGDRDSELYRSALALRAYAAARRKR